MNNFAEAFAEAIEKQNEQLKLYYIPTATGESLDKLGIMFGINRKTYFFGLVKESDRNYKKRLRTSIENINDKSKKKYSKSIYGKIQDLVS